MVKQDLILSMSEPTNRTIYAKKGDSGRLYDIFIADAEKENGTLRILQPDGSEVTAPAIIEAGGDAYKGDLVTFDALEEVPLTKCEVTLESSQDLHGQSSPYPSGGGKNKVDIPQNALHQTDYTVPYYYNIIPTTPYALTADQTYTVSFDYEITGTTTKPNFTVGLGNGANYATDLVSKTSIDTSGRLEFSFTPTSAQLSTYQYVAFRFPRYSSSKTVSWTISNFQLELGDQATSYAPYSNICPIYPSNEVNLYQRGKNILDLSSLRGGNFATSASLPNANITTDDFVPIVGGKTYVWSQKTHPVLGGKYLRFYDKDGVEIEADRKNIYGTAPFVFTASQNACYIKCMWYQPSPNYWQSVDDIVNEEPQIEVGNQATAYEPYQGTTYPLSLGQTVYGGTLDVVSGKLTVDHAIYTINSFAGRVEGNGFRASAATNLPNYNGGAYGELKCNMFGCASSYGEAVASIAPYTDNANKIGSNGGGQLLFNAYVNGAFATTINEVNALIPSEGCQIWYPCTETVIDLTPQQISTLLGTNNIWSSSEVEVAFEYDGLFAQLPEEATEQVGKCIGDVAFTGASSMPFILHILDDVQEETP